MHKRMAWSAGAVASGEGESAKAGKRTRTQGLAPRAAAPVEPVQLKPSNEPRAEPPDPFDFSFAEKDHEQAQAVAAEAPTTTTPSTSEPQETTFGTFTAPTYHSLTSYTIPIGAEIVLQFKPNSKVNAKEIAMVQIARTVDEGKVDDDKFSDDADKVDDDGDETEKRRAIPKSDADTFDSPALGTDEGFAIDQDPHEENPLYAVRGAPRNDDHQLTSGKTPKKVRKATRKEKQKLKRDRGIDNGTHAGLGQHGHRFKKKGEWKTKVATLHDAPHNPKHGNNAEQLFETAALAISGKQQGTYYGSVRWGWRTDSDGKFSLIPLTLVSAGDPSETFVKAAERWNRGTTPDGDPNIRLPIPGEDDDDWSP